MHELWTRFKLSIIWSIALFSTNDTAIDGSVAINITVDIGSGRSIISRCGVLFKADVDGGMCVLAATQWLIFVDRHLGVVLISSIDRFAVNVEAKFGLRRVDFHVYPSWIPTISR